MTTPKHDDLSPRSIATLYDANAQLAELMIGALIKHPQHWKAVAQAHDAGVIPFLTPQHKSNLLHHASKQPEARAYLDSLVAREKAAENGGPFHAILRSIGQQDWTLFQEMARQVNGLGEMISRKDLPDGWRLAPKLLDPSGATIVEFSRFTALALSAQSRKWNQINLREIQDKCDFELMAPALVVGGRGNRKIYTHLDLGLRCGDPVLSMLMEMAASSGELDSRRDEIVSAYGVEILNVLASKKELDIIGDMKDLGARIAIMSQYSILPEKSVLNTEIKISYKEDVEYRTVPKVRTVPLRLAMPMCENDMTIHRVDQIFPFATIPVSLWAYLACARSVDGLVAASEAGHDLNEVNEINRINPLHVAALLGDRAVIEAAIQLGVDSQARDVKNRLPQDWAGITNKTSVNAEKAANEFKSFVAACKARLVVADVHQSHGLGLKPL